LQEITENILFEVRVDGRGIYGFSKQFNNKYLRDINFSYYTFPLVKTGRKGYTAGQALYDDASGYHFIAVIGYFQ
jgi:hypothetical protein